MADDVTRHRLEVIGQQAFQQAFNSAQAAIDRVTAATEASGVRQRVVYDASARAAEQAADAQEQAARRAEAALKRQAEAAEEAVKSLSIISTPRSGVGRSFEERQGGVQGAIAAGAAQPELQEASRRAAQAAELNAQAQQRVQQAVEATAKQIGLVIAAQQAALNIVNQSVQARQREAQAVQALAVATRNAATVHDQIRRQTDNAFKTTTQIGSLAAQQRQEVARIQFRGDQAFRRQNPLIAGGPSRIDTGVTRDLTDRTTRTNELTQANLRKTKSITEQSAAEDNAKRHSITYLSALSAVHAASFLLGSQTFTNIGSLTTLGLAFGKVSVATGVLGVGLGTVLLGINQIVTQAQAVTQAFIGVATALGQVAVAGAAALTALAVTGVKAAAGVQTQFALLKGITSSTNDQLRVTEKVVGDVAVEFGVSASKVAEAGSFFVRAGRNLEDLEQGALKAIIALQIAAGGELEAATAAKTLAVALEQFNLTGKDTERVANVITTVAQRSALSFTEVSQAFQQAVPGAKSLGVSLEDLGAVVATLGDQLKGNIAGTAFKQFILDLVRPSKEAQEVLKQLGISMFELGTGKARPLEDVLIDLNKALGAQAVEAGRITPEMQKYALAVLFASRAGLAGEILTDKGVETFRKFREELQGVTATGVAATVLQTLNAQLGRLAVVAEEVVRAFGGPILQPLTEGAKQAVDALKGLIPVAQLAGQAVTVSLTGRGFDELNEKIRELTGNDELTLFFANIVNSANLAVNVITGQIIPAVDNFISSLSGFAQEKASVDNIGTAFDRVNTVIRAVGNVADVASAKLAAFVKEFVNAEGEGGRLRDIITNLAQGIGVQLVTALVSVVPATVAAVTILAKLGEVGAKIAGSLSGLFSRLADNLNAIEQDAITAAHNLTKLNLNIALGAAITAQDEKAAQEVINQIKELDKVTQNLRANRRNPLAEEFSDIAAAAKDAEDFVKTARAETDALTNLGSDAVEQIKATASTLTDLFSGLIDQVREVSNEPVRVGTGTTGGSNLNLVDEKALQRARDRLEEFQRDMGRRLANIAEDTATRNEQLLTNTLERIEDIFEKATRQIEKLNEDLRRREKEQRDQLAQSRADRRDLSFEQARVDFIAGVRERAAEAEQQAEERALDNIRRARDRNAEDAAFSYQNQQADAERAFAAIEAAAERSFQRQQQARKDALATQQDAETRALQDQLENAATQRQLARDLQKAKTPQERQEIQLRAGEAAQDRAFDKQQQAQLDALRLKQEKARKQQERQLEEEAIAFRANAELRVIGFRKTQEIAAVKERRRVEDEERTRRDTEDFQALNNRKIREATLAQERKSLELEVQNFRDQQEDAALNRSIARERTLAQEREREITSEATRQAGEALTEFDKQQNTRLAQVEQQLRSLQQQLQDLIENFIKEGTLPSNAEAVVASLGASTGQALGKAQGDVAQARTALTEAVDALTTKLEASQQLQPPAQRQVTPSQALAAGIQVVANLPPNFTTLMRDAFVQGLEFARANGILPTQQINVTTGATAAEIRQLLQEQLPLPTPFRR